MDTFRWGEKSAEIKEIAAALNQLQAKLEGAKKDADNPYFKSKYADLEGIWCVLREHMPALGLSVTQTMGWLPVGEDIKTTLRTTLLHTSGQYISGEMPLMPSQQNPQGQGSAITYARRYCLAAITGVYQVDDDAEAACRDTSNKTAAPGNTATHGDSDLRTAVKQAANEAGFPGDTIFTSPAAKSKTYTDLLKMLQAGVLKGPAAK